MAFLSWIEAHKDFFLVVAAVVAPFAAVLAALIASRWQARALLESTRLQIRAGASREYRQRSIEKLREELAAEIFYVSELRFCQQKGVGLNDLSVVRTVEEAQARKIRIRLLVGVAAERLNESFKLEEELIGKIRAAKPGQVWSEAENLAFDREIDRLGRVNLTVVEEELQAALGRE